MPGDLEHHTLLHDDTAYDGLPDWASWLRAAGASGVDATHGVRFNSVSLALEAAVDGQGVVLSLAPLAADQIDAGQLVAPFDLRLPLSYADQVVTSLAASEREEVPCFREWLMAESQSLR